MTPEQLAKLDELLETDMTLTQIAQELGMAYNTFRIRLLESDSVIRRQRFSLTEQRAIEAMRNAQREVAGFSKELVAA